MNGRIEMMGCLIDNLSMKETLQKIEALLVTRLGAPANAQPGSGPPR